MVPLIEFLDLEGVLRDMQAIFDAGRGKKWTMLQLAASVLRHYRPESAPPGITLEIVLKQFLSQMGTRHKEADAAEFEWRALFVAGMWFQDLFNYDFRRTEMCIIPYGTQMGEISFCAYNTGAGWRQIIEKMKANATVAEWYRRYGRHPVHAKNRPLELPDYASPITVVEHELAKEERAKSDEAPAAPRKKLKHLPVVGA
ncbi:MAG TPA: radical SAM protein, partial [Polyangiaceae bacterium]|nr:radical SAM protein [Polyangiaceae bacterium]